MLSHIGHDVTPNPYLKLVFVVGISALHGIVTFFDWIDESENWIIEVLINGTASWFPPGQVNPIVFHLLDPTFLSWILVLAYLGLRSGGTNYRSQLSCHFSKGRGWGAWHSCDQRGTPQWLGWSGYYPWSRGRHWPEVASCWRRPWVSRSSISKLGVTS